MNEIHPIETRHCADTVTQEINLSQNQYFATNIDTTH